MAAATGNKYAMGNSGGRPAHYDTAEELAAASQDYFDWCLNTGIKSTVTGLALYLGFCSRSTFDDYEKRTEEFSYVIRRSKLAVENSYELSGTPFDIFALKNMGWKDKTEIENSGNMSLTWNETKNYPGG
jgi:hypothetical protein